MALHQHHCFSSVLGKHVQMNVLHPERGRGPYPVFYLLHGLSDDYSIWQRNTSLERYVAGLPLIVVCPDGYRGFYTDNHAGPYYERYLLDDVIGYIDRTYKTRAKRAGRCIGGLSMGGYGALRLGLRYPERFCSVTAHSSATRPWAPKVMKNNPERKRVFGLRPAGTEHDLCALLDRAVEKKLRLPELKLDCGTEDFLLDDNRWFISELMSREVPHRYDEYPGAHSWSYWDMRIQEALAFHASRLDIKPL